MWKIIQELLPFVFVILLLTQWVIPIILNKRTWWIFKKESEDIKQKVTTNISHLKDEIENIKEVVDEVKSKVDIVKEKVEDNLKEAEDLKKIADKLK